MTEELETRQVFLGMPGYGDMSSGAALAFFQATSGKVNVNGRSQDVFIRLNVNEGSLLAHNFNKLWCVALNSDAAGQRVDNFAMLHSDAEPEIGWLDQAIEELYARDLDVLGVVLPIKCPDGLTSIALDRPDGDTWRPLCRLTMREICALPETFTAADVGHPLLLNTGCWVCRFDPQWAKQVSFTINDRISFDQERGMYVADVEPEDWNFSRQCNRLGLKLGVTRKISANHVGRMKFGNATAWGHKSFDSEYIAESILPATTANGFALPSIDGWLLPAEGEKLAELAAGKRVLEIGSYCGLSTVCMARTAQHVTAVDYFDGRGTPKPQDTLPAFRANLARYGLTNVETRHPDDPLPQAEYDLAFIDGAHDGDSVRRDIAKTLEALKPGGLLVFHDYRREPGDFDGGWDPDVSGAVEELVLDGGELLFTHATLAVVKPPAEIFLEV